MLSGAAAASIYTSVLRQVIFINREDEPSSVTRVIEFLSSDGKYTSQPGQSRVSIILVNDHSPVVDLDAAQESSEDFSTGFIEGGPAVRVTGSSVTITVLIKIVGSLN